MVRDEAKERIIKASIALFSEKGYDGTRVNEISEAAKVNKALIYYYFKNKEAILDYLLENLFNDIKELAMGFIRNNVVRMIQEGDLDIEEDRFHFSDKAAMDFFLQNINTYYERMIDYVIERRDVFRIMMLESLKHRKHPFNVFRFMEMLESRDSNPLYKIIKNADDDFTITNEVVMFKFFFGLIPILSLATFFDDWLKLKSIEEKELRDLFIKNYQLLSQMFVKGNDILITGTLP
ncbi:MAG: TetR family transcriptional regulator [Bacillota bacterium]|nr:TetR family transcriptional regulator [Bacillota bacterium]